MYSCGATHSTVPQLSSGRSAMSRLHTQDSRTAGQRLVSVQHAHNTGSVAANAQQASATQSRLFSAATRNKPTERAHALHSNDSQCAHAPART